MNKKNIIMLSIAALLLANCAYSMEKETKKKESPEEYRKMYYDFKDENAFFTKLKQRPEDKRLIQIHITIENWSESFGLGAVQAFVVKVLSAGYNLKSGAKFSDNCNSDILEGNMLVERKS